MTATSPWNILRTGNCSIGSTALALLVFAAGAQAGPLTRIMDAMESDYQAISRALLREEYPRIERAAQSLAEHPTPGITERLTLLARLGPDAGQFQELDARVKQAASDIVSAAAAESPERVVEGFHRLTRGCVTCHRQFGEQFGSALSGSGTRR